MDAITAILDIGKAAITRIWPDPVKQVEEQRKLIELSQAGDIAQLNAHVQLMLAQIEVNNTQAKSKSVFVAGARPFIIWMGGFSLAWSGVLHPILTWVWAFAEMSGQPPPLIESGVLASVVTGLLGVSGMRSYDKVRGTQTDKI